MKYTVVIAVALALSMPAAAQAQSTGARPGGSEPSAEAPEIPIAPEVGRAVPRLGMDFRRFRPPDLLHEWWKDPIFINELHLTDAQQKQLQEASLTQRLALIDAGAAGLKSFVRLQSLLNSDALDEAAYNQQLAQLTNACGTIVQDFGKMVLTMRRVLTAEQWRKLQSMQRRPGLRPLPGVHEGGRSAPGAVPERNP